jgi:hypothetical protein
MKIRELGQEEPLNFKEIQRLYKQDLQRTITRINYLANRSIIITIQPGVAGDKPQLQYRKMQRMLHSTLKKGIRDMVNELPQLDTDIQYQEAYKDLLDFNDCLGPFLTEQGETLGKGALFRDQCDKAIRALSEPPVKKEEVESLVVALQEPFVLSTVQYLQELDGPAGTDSVRCREQEWVRGFAFEDVSPHVANDSLRHMLMNGFFTKCHEYDTALLYKLLKRAFPEYTFIPEPSDSAAGVKKQGQ